MKEDIEVKYKSIIEQPNLNEFIKLIEQLSKNNERGEAREVCFRILKNDPSNKIAKIELSKLFYLDGMNDFAARELIELRKNHNSASIDKILNILGVLNNNTASDKEKIVSEIEVEFDE